MHDKDIIFMECELRALRVRYESLIKIVDDCIGKFERPELIVPELVAFKKEIKNAKI